MIEYIICVTTKDLSKTEIDNINSLAIHHKYVDYIQELNVPRITERVTLDQLITLVGSLESDLEHSRSAYFYVERIAKEHNLELQFLIKKKPLQFNG